MRYPGQFNRAAYDPLNPYQWQPYTHYPDLPEQSTNVTPPQLNKVKDQIEANIDKIYADINEINRINYEDHPPAIVGMVEMYWGNPIRLPAGWTLCDGSPTDPDRELFKTHGTTHKPNFLGRYPKGSNTPLAPAQTAPTTYKTTRNMIPWKPLTITYGTQTYTSTDAATGLTPYDATTSGQSADHTHTLVHSHNYDHSHTLTHSHGLNNHVHTIGAHGHTGSVWSSGATSTGSATWHNHERNYTNFNNVPGGGGRTIQSAGGGAGSPTNFTYNEGQGPGGGGLHTHPQNRPSYGMSINAQPAYDTTGAVGSTANNTHTTTTSPTPGATNNNTAAPSTGTSTDHTHTYTISHNYTETSEGANDDLPYFEPYHQEILYIIYEGAIV